MCPMEEVGHRVEILTFLKQFCQNSILEQCLVKITTVRPAVCVKKPPGGVKIPTLWMYAVVKILTHRHVKSIKYPSPPENNIDRCITVGVILPGGSHISRIKVIHMIYVGKCTKMVDSTMLSLMAPSFFITLTVYFTLLSEHVFRSGKFNIYCLPVSVYELWY